MEFLSKQITPVILNVAPAAAKITSGHDNITKKQAGSLADHILDDKAMCVTYKIAGNTTSRNIPIFIFASIKLGETSFLFSIFSSQLWFKF